MASALAKEPGKRPADAFTFASELRTIRRDFAPDREDPHTHVTAEVIAEPGRPQRDASQITSAHLAAPTAPDEDIGKLMDALRAGEGAVVADVLRDMESQPCVSITGFESTAKSAAAIPPSPGKPVVQRDAVTALPRSGSSERAPGSVRYVTKEAVVDAPSPKPGAQQTVPMARPAPVHHYTEPMAGRPGRFAHPVAHDGRTPEPLAINNPRPPRGGSSAARGVARIRRRVERFVPLRALPVALALGIVGWLGGMSLMRTKGADLNATSTTPAASTAPMQASEVPARSSVPSPPAPTAFAALAVTPEAGVAAPVVTTASLISTPTIVKQPPRAAAPTASPPLVPVKKTSKPSDIGFE